MKQQNRVGYIYCLSNPVMPGICKVGMTKRMPDVRAKELFTTGVAHPFKIEFAKKVYEFKQKEQILHTILSRYSERVSYNREFFRISCEEVRNLFELIDGELWCETTENDTCQAGLFVFDVVIATK
jgi:hypothetical protein